MSPLPSRRMARSSFSADALRSYGQDLMKTLARRHGKMRRPLKATSADPGPLLLDPRPAPAVLPTEGHFKNRTPRERQHTEDGAGDRQTCQG
jgi:hypothetical protein